MWDTKEALLRRVEVDHRCWAVREEAAVGYLKLCRTSVCRGMAVNFTVRPPPVSEKKASPWSRAVRPDRFKWL